MNETQLAFVTVFEGNLSLIAKIATKLHVRTPEELQLFTYEYILKTASIGDWAGYIKRQMTDHGMPLRDFDESVPDAVVRLYGSLMSAPITVLQFSLADELARHRPIHVINLYAVRHPGLKVFDFGLMLEYVKQETVPRTFADELVRRLEEWELRDIPE